MLGRVRIHGKEAGAVRVHRQRFAGQADIRRVSGKSAGSEVDQVPYADIRFFIRVQGARRRRGGRFARGFRGGFGLRCRSCRAAAVLHELQGNIITQCKDHHTVLNSHSGCIPFNGDRDPAAVGSPGARAVFAQADVCRTVLQQFDAHLHAVVAGTDGLAFALHLFHDPLAGHSAVRFRGRRSRRLAGGFSCRLRRRAHRRGFRLDVAGIGEILIFDLQGICDRFRFAAGIGQALVEPEAHPEVVLQGQDILGHVHSVLCVGISLQGGSERSPVFQFRKVLDLLMVRLQGRLARPEADAQSRGVSAGLGRIRGIHEPRFTERACGNPVFRRNLRGH